MPRCASAPLRHLGISGANGYAKMSEMSVSTSCTSRHAGRLNNKLGKKEQMLTLLCMETYNVMRKGHSRISHAKMCIGTSWTSQHIWCQPTCQDVWEVPTDISAWGILLCMLVVGLLHQVSHHCMSLYIKMLNLSIEICCSITKVQLLMFKHTVCE